MGVRNIVLWILDASDRVFWKSVLGAAVEGDQRFQYASRYLFENITYIYAARNGWEATDIFYLEA
jgi:hypothetical protein